MTLNALAIFCAGLMAGLLLILATLVAVDEIRSRRQERRARLEHDARLANVARILGSTK